LVDGEQPIASQYDYPRRRLRDRLVAIRDGLIDLLDARSVAGLPPPSAVPAGHNVA